MLYMIQIWCPPPPPQCACARICSKLKAKRVLFIYSSSGRPSASTPLERPRRQWPRPSMVLLGCLCHSLLKMNAQDEQQWLEIYAKAITVSFCKAQKIHIIIKLKVYDHCPYLWTLEDRGRYRWFHRRTQTREQWTSRTTAPINGFIEGGRGSYQWFHRRTPRR